jgi:hypothetical protein
MNKLRNEIFVYWKFEAKRVCHIYVVFVFVSANKRFDEMKMSCQHCAEMLIH